jgi:hypothetical protein
MVPIGANLRAWRQSAPINLAPIGGGVAELTLGERLLIANDVDRLVLLHATDPRVEHRTVVMA